MKVYIKLLMHLTQNMYGVNIEQVHAHLQRGVHEAQVARVGQAAGLHAARPLRRVPPRQLRKSPVQSAQWLSTRQPFQARLSLA